MPSRIEDYALIGDCESAALVGLNGSVDWLCWPRFDSDACFAALLGTPDHGRWLIAPAEEPRVTRRYRPGTLVLETRFETAAGAVSVVDFMPLRVPGSELIRLVIGERGQVRMCTELVLRFGYGAHVPWMVRLDDQTLRAIAGPDMVLLRTPVKLKGEGLKSVAEFTVSAGETVPFVLVHSASHLPPPKPLDPMDELATTERFWTEWIGRSTVKSPWREVIDRSLITLKSLTYAPTGGLVAAPTTSLPEKLGGARNWDYRFCWLRDATLTLLALMNAGYLEEACAWREWLLRAAAGAPSQMQIMYGIAGERRLTEWDVTWLPGYEGSQPVRIGNAAHEQLQLDVYGELMDTLHQARAAGIAQNQSGWDLQCAILDHLQTVWTRPDNGIWETREPGRHFTYSKVMAWVAFDRAIKSAEISGLGGDIARWRALRARIHADVCQHGFDPTLGSFVRSYGSRDLDASLLLLPVLGFLPPSDPRILGTISAVEHRLMNNGLLMRYDTFASHDGLPPGEGAFLACSFWLVDAFVLTGRHDEARELFDQLLSLRNDVGLLSEQYDSVARRQIGNFPQAFSHLALVNSAFMLAKNEHAAHPQARRAESEEKMPT